MSFKSEIGDYVEYLIRGETFEVDVYNLELNYNYDCVSVTPRGYIDVEGDLFVEVELSENNVLELVGGISVLDHFTEEEIKEYLEEHYGE